MKNNLRTLPHVLRKLFFTLKNFKKTAYGYYGNRPSSMMLYIYYGLFRVNTFLIFECDLRANTFESSIESPFRALAPTLEELDHLRKGRDLPREFFYDEIHNVTNCCLALFEEEIAHIHWLYFKGDYSRFLILNDGTCELNYFFTLPKYRGRGISSIMLAHSARHLRELGYEKAAVVVHQNNVSFIKNVKKLPFQEAKRIKTFGPFNRRVAV
jgi:ribosomal protein S18 acetylase RimI-like enzyme